MISRRSAILYTIAMLLLICITFAYALGLQVETVGANNDFVFSAETVDVSFVCPLNGFH